MRFSLGIRGPLRVRVRGPVRARARARVRVRPRARARARLSLRITIRVPVIIETGHNWHWCGYRHMPGASWRWCLCTRGQLEVVPPHLVVLWYSRHFLRMLSVGHG